MLSSELPSSFPLSYCCLGRWLFLGTHSVAMTVLSVRVDFWSVSFCFQRLFIGKFIFSSGYRTRHYGYRTRSQENFFFTVFFSILQDLWERLLESLLCIIPEVSTFYLFLVRNFLYVLIDFSWIPYLSLWIPYSSLWIPYSDTRKFCFYFYFYFCSMILYSIVCLVFLRDSW